MSARPAIVFSGARGAFGELAARQYFGEGADIAPVLGFDAVFSAVKRKRADFGVIPIENTCAGSVYQNYDLLFDSRLYIVGEVFLQVNHCLTAKPGTSVEAVRSVFSHPQALAQCARFLKRHPRMKQIEAENTALAAKAVSEDGRADTAAIASSRAAADFGLKVLIPGIQDRDDNMTRFLVVSRTRSTKDSAPRKTSIAFSLKNTPGALFKALGVFALRDIDLFKIESRPIHGKGFEYLFYLDCRGDISDETVKNAVSHLKEIATFYRLLGSYNIGG
ncbi:prephenate dehydratase [Fibrobacteres bacterium R8-0-B4]